jgi:formylglycine-generating enzyme required for sulfatase activity
MLRRLILASPLAIVAGCNLFFDTAALGVQAAEADAAPEGAPTSNNGCPTTEGAPMVRIDDFCIDSTEVTRGQYGRFLADVALDAGGRPVPPQCAENKSFEPLDPKTMSPPATESPDFPVRAVDWCDAKAYCTWAGKDLCGSVDGSPLVTTEVVDPARSQWAKACSHDGTTRFPYGDTYERGRCNVEDGPTRPAAASTCTGGYPGIVDIVGNVAEWVDACEPPLDARARCAFAGGHVGRGEGTGCTTFETPQGSLPSPSAGIRCCARVTR